MWKPATASGENFSRCFRRTVREKFSAPIEKIRLTRVLLGSKLVFADGLERMLQLFFNLGEQVMQFGLIVIARIQLRGPPQIDKRFSGLSIVGQYFSKLAMCVEALGCASNGLAQRFFRDAGQVGGQIWGFRLD